MRYFVKTPWWLKRLYSTCLWEMSVKDSQQLFLTFDDGPHPQATSFVLDELKKYNAKATFFCIGKNVMLYPDLYRRILEEGHAIGNHTFDHLNGWKTADAIYINNILAAKQYIDSGLFRPPYGRITNLQLKLLRSERLQLQPVMWTVLSGDFDKTISNETCLKNVIGKSSSGSIVVFHDSEKAWERLVYALPKTLEFFAEKGYSFEAIRI